MNAAPNYQQPYGQPQGPSPWQQPSRPVAPAAVAEFMGSVYRWMAVGLVLTGVIAALVAGSEELIMTIFRTPLRWGLFLGLIAMAVVFGRSVERVGFGTLAAMFVSFCALNGLALSSTFYVFTRESVALALYTTGGTFAAMSAYGTLTKRDLTGWGSMLMMAVMGLFIAGLLNMVFFHSSVLSMVASVIGVLVFTALTAYHTQKIRALAVTGNRNYALAGALLLYLDFINIFVYLLNLFGRRR